MGLLLKENIVSKKKKKAMNKFETYPSRLRNEVVALYKYLFLLCCGFSVVCPNAK